MRRFRVTVTVTRDYDANPELYGTDDARKMIEIDENGISDDPMIMMDHPDSEWNIRVDDITANMDFVDVAGYKVPANTSTLARTVLEKLSAYGVAVFHYDDGPSSAVASELVNIAESLDFDYFPAFHFFVSVAFSSTCF
jgi:hypothetical protein